MGLLDYWNAIVDDMIQNEYFVRLEGGFEIPDSVKPDEVEHALVRRAIKHINDSLVIPSRQAGIRDEQVSQRVVNETLGFFLDRIVELGQKKCLSFSSKEVIRNQLVNGLENEYRDIIMEE